MAFKHTPTPWRLRIHPGAESQPQFYAEEFHISAVTTEDHPYFHSCSEIEIMCDDKYPRRRIDAKRIIATINACDQAGLSNEFLESGGLERFIYALKYAIDRSGDSRSHYPAVDVLKEVKIND